jgi:hypothetical protein
VTGFFFKHNLIILPVALAVWLALTDREAALKFAALGLGFLIVGSIAFRVSFGVDLFQQLQSARVYSTRLLLAGFGKWLAWNGLPLMATLIALAPERREPFALFCAIYIATGIVVGAVFYGGAGVDINAMFDAFIALSLAIGFVLMRWRGTKCAALIAAIWMVVFAAISAVSFERNWLTADYWLEPMNEERRSAETDIAFLRGRPGPALCEMLSLCYWAGKPAEADLFNLGQQYKTGKRRDDELVTLVTQRKFAVIQVDPDGSFALTPRIEKVFEANYRRDHANDSDGAFYVPR